MTQYRAVIAVGLLLSVVLSIPVCGDRPRQSKLLRTLTGRNEAIRMRAIAGIGTDGASQRAALDDMVAAVRRHVEETSDDELARPSTVRLIYLIGSVNDPRAENLMIELLDAPHLGIAIVAADVLGKNKIYGGIEHLKKQVDRPDFASSYGFRYNIVRALTRMEHPDAVEFLSELRPSLDGELAHQLDEWLAEVTVSHFLGDEQRFDDWKNIERRESIFQPAGFEPESLKRIRLGRDNKYYGIDIHARRLMFIIDNSGSMREYWGGATRLERAKGELIHAIKDLPADAEFSIVFFHTTVNQWRSELVEASEENKRAAIQSVRRLGYGNKTNTHGALLQALAFDEQLEAVFLLTDGKPTAGKIISTAGIVNEILHRNRFRHLNFNTIGIGVQGPTEAFLRTLAEQTGGEFRLAQ